LLALILFETILFIDVANYFVSRLVFFKVPIESLA